MSKVKNLSLKNQLENEIKSKINPVTIVNFNKEKYKEIWRDYDMQQCCSRYVWKNLPSELDSWNIERMLYFRSSLVFFKLLDKFYILPYAISGKIDKQGYPESVKPVSFNGETLGTEFLENFELNTSDFDTEDKRGFILHDKTPLMPSIKPLPRRALNEAIIDDIGETFARLHNSLIVNSKKLFFIAKDRKQAETMRREIEQGLSSDTPFEIITSPLELQSVLNNADNSTLQYFETIKNYDSVRCFISGISNKGFGSDKKERLVTGELLGIDEQTNLVADLSLEYRKEFVKKVNSYYNLNIEVYKRADFYEDKTGINGKGESIKDEVKDDNIYI